MDSLKRKSTSLYKLLVIHSQWSSGYVRGSALAALGILYLKVWLPVTGLGIPCVFHEFTGLYCPGCGITRALQAYLQLDAAQAVRFNALLPVLLPLFAAYAWSNRQNRRRTSRALMAAMLVATVAFGIARNVPALRWLAPATG